MGFNIPIFGYEIPFSFYGFSYAIGILIGYFFIKSRKIIPDEKLDNLLLYIFFGIILGGRLGYIIFYDPIFFLQNPLEILKTWNGGMAFHGGVIGFILAVIIFCTRNNLSFYKVIDELVKIVPVGIFLGRIANYLNKELLGFPYNGFLALELNGEKYFPSPLIEAFLEGIILFLILNFFVKKRFDGHLGSLFLIWYGIFRIFVEIFFRVHPESVLKIYSNFTMGQFLSLIMVIIGTRFYFYLGKK